MANVLLVDDDRDLLESLEVRLNRKGYQCTLADNANEAMAAAGHKFFDVVLSDYHMPEKTGLAFLSEFKDLQPGCARILMSGQLDLPLVMDAVNHGEVHRVIDKPFQIGQLEALILEALDQRKRLKHLHSALERKDAEGEYGHLKDCLQGSLRLAIQPIYNTQGLDVAAYEGLIRSDHAMLPGPAQVIDAAERQGMICALAEFVIQQAVDWLTVLDPSVRLFVNLHPQELADPGMLAHRLTRLQPHAARTVLEITERSHVMDYGAWRESTDIMRAAGFQLAVDDLGAGYSSLAVLAELVPNVIKIDMSIVRDIDKDQHKRRLVVLLCQLAQSMDAELVAEGVETKAEFDVLADCGADLIQGFYLGKPDFVPVAMKTSAQLASHP